MNGKKWSWAGPGGRSYDMLEYLAYAAFLVGMFLCLRYIMNSLETEDAPQDRDR